MYVRGYCNQIVIFAYEKCYGPSSSAPIDVKTGYQIRRNLLRFGVKLDSEDEI
jgi:hypothetical protein